MGLVPSCHLSFWIVCGSKIFFCGYCGLKFALWVFCGSEIFSCGYRFFLMGICGFKIFSHGYFLGLKYFLWVFKGSNFFLVVIDVVIQRFSVAGWMSKSEKKNIHQDIKIYISNHVSLAKSISTIAGCLYWKSASILHSFHLL